METGLGRSGPEILAGTSGGSRGKTRRPASGGLGWRTFISMGPVARRPRPRPPLARPDPSRSPIRHARGRGEKGKPPDRDSLPPTHLYRRRNFPDFHGRKNPGREEGGRVTAMPWQGSGNLGSAGASKADHDWTRDHDQAPAAGDMGKARGEGEAWCEIARTGETRGRCCGRGPRGPGVGNTSKRRPEHGQAERARERGKGFRGINANGKVGRGRGKNRFEAEYSKKGQITPPEKTCQALFFIQNHPSSVRRFT